jgi:hypothetical protein
VATPISTTQTALGPAPDVEAVGAVPAVSTAAVSNLGVPAEETETQVREEKTTMAIAVTMRIEKTEEALAAHPLKGAAGHPTGETSGGTGQEMPSPVRFCKA